ncbi:hypothetical protein CHGG_08807 [Chaetomium globosum CBS 148.51]|uniref:Leucine-rich repeat-containing protein 40 n=1 Tax=Chaetomium globosum (strain ATCC 6205 / CBS 148.51 / DSM 1962 / NBRC 6347 / NRRL 1970) TaxID=306901 RepID=Q2GT97_CHAGB|nr:uncharacterized protein CHGG_08807 [Chaetomium globosum CBS 148.51]EAQ84793.1 hypothetical protein CHGG_08807 [Chaetomium globosum CBS 148.51]
MDETRQSRPSGLPRPSKIPVQTSKLPIPRTNSIRTSPSREGLATTAGAGSLRNPKLRTAVSRDQLAPSPTTPTRAKSRSPTSTAPLRAVSSPHSRAGLSQPSAGNTHTGRLAPSSSAQSLRPTRGGTQAIGPGARSSSATTGLLRRQSSQQWISATAMPEEEPSSGESGTTVADGKDTVPESPSKSGPSLAERTMETLFRLPSSPSVKGRDAPSFYDPASGRPPSRPGSRTSRPGSSHQSDTSSGRPRAGSRPGSSSGLEESISSFRSQIATYENPLSPIEGTPLRNRRSIQSFQSPSVKATPSKQGRTSMYGMPPPSAIAAPRTRTPSPGKREPEVSIPKSTSKTLAPRPPTKRPSVNGLFKKPSQSKLGGEAPRKASLVSRGSSVTSWDGTIPSSASVASGSTGITADSAEPGQTQKKSSAALREQIAKAKAAKKAAFQQAASNAAAVSEDSTLVPTDSSFDFGLSSDPFNQNRDDKSQAKVLQTRLGTARTSGRLNIAAMGLKDIPAEVLDMYNLESIGQSGSAWAESVDLTRFVAADNELEMLSDSVFPDVDPQELAEDEDSQGNIFAGLETLDLHGNILVNLPMGLRRLAFLTSLNLSLNRLSNSSLEVICHITSLKDLKLGGNLLYGPLDPCLSNLESLEILDLHGNNLSSLPETFSQLSRLRILNLSENGFEELPFALLAGLPLRELIARKNQLHGTLIQDTVDALPTLQTLDVASNQLAHICSFGKTVAMPALHQFCVSMNRLQSLPDISSWTSLLTIAADENNINAIPEGFTSLPQLKSVDFSSNDIRIVPSEIGKMENLVNLRLSGNPLREKKFSTISTDEMKTILAQRLEPSAEEDEQQAQPAPGGANDEYFTADDTTTSIAAGDDDSRSELDNFATPPTSTPASPARARSQTASWPVKSGGVLDRSNTQSSSLHPVICSKLATAHKIHEIQLHHNLFASFPESLTFFATTLTALSLAHNQLIGESYLGGASGNDSLELPSLKELNLGHNHITGLSPLTTHLRAPQLQKLDISFNRLTALPPATTLRDMFPNLTVLLVSNNHLTDLDPETIRGMKVVDAANNDIAHLNPRIGLLGGHQGAGLERLDVSGNRFRVPRWNVLERGTEATLRWLRGRVPVAEMGAWKGEEGEDGEDVD